MAGSIAGGTGLSTGETLGVLFTSPDPFKTFIDLKQQNQQKTAVQGALNAYTNPNFVEQNGIPIDKSTMSDPNLFDQAKVNAMQPATQQTRGRMALEKLAFGAPDVAAKVLATQIMAKPEEPKLNNVFDSVNNRTTVMSDATLARMSQEEPGRYAIAGQMNQEQPTADEKNVVSLYGKDWRTNPAAVDYFKRTTQPMSVNLNANSQFEKEFDKAEGKSLGEAAAEIYTAADKSRNRAALQDQFMALSEGYNTGKLSPAMSTVGAWAQALNIDPTKLGIPANAAMSGEAMDVISNSLTMESIGPGGIPANNFSEADRKFAQATQIQQANTPQGNKLIRQISQAKDKRNIEKEAAWIAARKRGVDFPEFKAQWAEHVSKTSAFPKVSSPEEMSKLPSGTIFSAPDGSLRVKP